MSASSAGGLCPPELIAGGHGDPFRVPDRIDEILIVGAGPTGLALALQLERYGVRARIVERAHGRRHGSKALSINPSTLYLFEALGVADAIVRAGRKVTRATVTCDGCRLAAVDLSRLPYRYNHFVMLPQPQTERILAEQLTTKGIAIEEGITLVGLQERDDVVVATTVDEAGRSEQRAYRYVIGCDGPRSTVRGCLGVSFTGVDYPMHFLMADARIDWDGPRDRAAYVMANGSFAIVLPLTDTLHRVVVKVDGPFAERTVTPAEVQAALQACLGERLRLHEAVWVSGAPFYNRLASANRKGRVFLAGDAAHLFSPLGGYGMNTGVGDAFNLGWKLAYAVRGLGSEALLRSYETERLQLAQRLVMLTDRSTSLMARLDRHTPADEALWRPVQRNRPNLRALPYGLSGFAHSYEPIPTGRSGRAVLENCVAPFIDALRSPPAAGDRRGGKHLLVVNAAAVNGAWSAWQAALQRIQERCDDFVHPIVFGRPAGAAGPDAGISFERDAAPLATFGFGGPGVALVRPDYYVEKVQLGDDPWPAIEGRLREAYRC